MDAFHAIGDRARRKIVAWWHLLPWWERVLYVVTTLLFVPTVLLTVLEFGFPLTDPPLSSWFKYGPILLRLDDVNSILLVVFFSCCMASILLVWRRKRPDDWSDARQLWSARAILVGFGIVVAITIWTSIVDLATPLEDQLSSNTPSFLFLAAVAVSGFLIGGGIVLVIPELIVRERRAKRRQV
jgi:hypothetical protein